MLHFTVGHPRTAAMLDLHESSRRSGLDFRPLRPTGERERIIFIDKYVTLAHALNDPTIRPHDIIMFTDAYDTLVVGGVSEICRAFASTGSDIVFNGETTFWPPSEMPDDPLKAYFDNYSTEPCRYLNSGCYIGYAGAVRQMLEYCLNQSSNDNDHDDQRLACRFLIDGAAQYDLKITVDSTCSIFATLGGSIEDYQYSGGAVRNARTGRWPPIIHANGAKEPIEALTILNAIQRLKPEGLDLLAIHSPGGFLHQTGIVHAQPTNGICVAVRIGPYSAILLAPNFTSLRSFRPDQSVGTAIWAKNWEIVTFKTGEVRTCHDLPLTAYGLGTSGPMTVHPFPLAALSHWTSDQLRALLVTLSSL